MPEIEDIALFDLDGTLCDYDKGLLGKLEELRAPEEPQYLGNIRDHPQHLKNRSDIIRSSESWWENLPRFQLGWDILEVAKNLGYRIVILTQGPKRNPNAWSGKKKWIDRNLGEGVDVIITRDKSLTYGKVLVDDYPEYTERWLQWRKNGLVIMPANKGNVDYKNPQVIRYDGSNLEQVRKAMEEVKMRK